MARSTLPKFNMDRSETSCCPRFDPTGWDGEEFEFVERPFVRATAVSFLYIPINLGGLIARTIAKIAEAGATPRDECFMLSSDLSPWRSEHLFAVSRNVPGAEMVRLSGKFYTKVFEGPFRDAGKWAKELTRLVQSHGKQARKIYFFYTTCPRCIKHYGKNYVVGFAAI